MMELLSCCLLPFTLEMDSLVLTFTKALLKKSETVTKWLLDLHDISFHKLIYGHILKPYLTLQTFFDNCSNNYLTLCKCD